MSSNPSPNPVPVSGVPVSPVSPVPDDRLAAELRRFGPAGIFAILLILFTGNVLLGQVVLPVGAAKVTVEP